MLYSTPRFGDYTLLFYCVAPLDFLVSTSPLHPPPPPPPPSTRNCSTPTSNHLPTPLVMGMSAVNVTVVPAFPLDRLWCVMSFVLVFFIPIKDDYGISVLPGYIFGVLAADVPVCRSTGPWDALKKCPTIQDILDAIVWDICWDIGFQRFQMASAQAGLSASRSKREESKRADG